MNEGSEQDNQQQAGWVFKPGDSSPVPSVVAAENPYEAPAAPSSSRDIVNWSASEYIANPKNAGWFMSLGFCTLILAAAVYFITNDWVSVVVILMLGIITGVFAARQPKTLQYSLDQAGLHMGEKFYPYHSFKSFSVVAEGAFSHISLMPLKRFMPPLAIHYPPSDEEVVVSTLADYLPYEEHKPDMVENFSRRVRF